MATRAVEARNLPESPLKAAWYFAAHYVQIVQDADCDFVVIFDAADHSHESWREAVIEELAREATPRRINAVVGSDGKAIGEAIAYLDKAPGVTGQILEVADTTA